MLQQSAVKITIRGLSPLLQNNPISMLKGNDDNAKVRRVKVSPEVEAESTTYRDSNGALFIPSSAIFGCILNGASDLKVKGTRKSGASILKGSILGITDITGTQRQVTIRDENGNPKVNIEIYSARCVIQRASVIKHRAMIDNWTMEFVVKYASEYIASSSLIIDALERGGILVGIGDYRPEKKGEFGRFEVVNHQEL